MCPVNRTSWELNEIPESMRQYFKEHEVQCGAPWERVVEKGDLIDDGKRNHNVSIHELKDKRDVLDRGWNHEGGFAPNAIRESKTIGWKPSCKCGHKEPVPCIVLDPFGGSGTTKNVADRLGRRGVMLELKMEYIEMAKKRCYEEPSLF